MYYTAARVMEHVDIVSNVLYGCPCYGTCRHSIKWPFISREACQIHNSIYTINRCKAKVSKLSIYMRRHAWKFIFLNILLYIRPTTYKYLHWNFEKDTPWTIFAILEFPRNYTYCLVTSTLMKKIAFFVCTDFYNKNAYFNLFQYQILLKLSIGK